MFISNQFIIKTGNFKKHSYKYYFQSYSTIIAKIDETDKTIRENFQPQIILDNNALHYSRTTSKYLYKFLRMNRKQIENKIKNKEIKLKNLN